MAKKCARCEPAEPASSFRAVCQRGACQAVRAQAAPECRSDAECTIVYPAPGALTLSCNLAAPLFLFPACRERPAATSS